MPQPKRRQTQEDKGIKYIITKILIGSVLGIALFFILLSLAALVILKNPLDSKILPIITLFISALSAFAAGFISVRPIRKNGILMGVCSSLPLIIAVCAAILFESGGSVGVMTAVAVVVMLVCAAIGGIAAVNMKKRNK
ncbi:MAG: TIGR04086 family membrane protein [Clostridia bacterium]|nr:TIGR04086 family membrane protein [Clostridia bacterium]MBQ7046146.1 TIGR04086 family membrane protein [Oscillospiraceae bacterium]